MNMNDFIDLVGLTVREKDGRHYCKNCVRWYTTRADQCNIPNPGFVEESSEFRQAVCGNTSNCIDREKMEFAKKHLVYIHFSSRNKIFGHPTQLNRNNDCPFYKKAPLPFLTGIWRMFY